MRIAELGGSDAKGIVARDIFVFNADPQGGEGALQRDGVVPRLANDLAARGMKLDPAIFKRAGRSSGATQQDRGSHVSCAAPCSSARLTILRWVRRFFSGPMWSIIS